jgi:hypothetical protein
MGFKPPRKIYNLDFTDTDYDGLHVRMRGMTVGEQLDTNLDGAEAIIATVATLLIDWNIDDEYGEPVPANLEGLRSQDGPVATAIFHALTTAISGVPAPLPEGSHSGEPSLVASIPTETLSESLAS